MSWSLSSRGELDKNFLDMSTSGYRRILRSINFAFRGDQLAIKMARKQLRAEFLKNATSTNMTQHMAELDELDEMLRFHIVQGKRSGNDGNFGKYVLSVRKCPTLT